MVLSMAKIITMATPPVAICKAYRERKRQKKAQEQTKVTIQHPILSPSSKRRKNRINPVEVLRADDV